MCALAVGRLGFRPAGMGGRAAGGRRRAVRRPERRVEALDEALSPPDRFGRRWLEVEYELVPLGRRRALPAEVTDRPTALPPSPIIIRNGTTSAFACRQCTVPLPSPQHELFFSGTLPHML